MEFDTMASSLHTHTHTPHSVSYPSWPYYVVEDNVERWLFLPKPGIDFKCALPRPCSARDQLQDLVYPYALHPLSYISDPLKLRDMTLHSKLV